MGKKGRDQLRRTHSNLFVGHVDLSEVKRIGYTMTPPTSPRTVLQHFDAGEFDVATLYFSKFHSVISQAADRASAGALRRCPRRRLPTSTLYEYEPDEEGILADLLPRNVATQIFTALLENAASEQGARMTAMDNATRNAGEMIDRLTIVYNRTRQAAITKELIEIISGAEAL